MVLMYTVNYVFAPGVQHRRFIDTIIFLPSHLFFTYTQMYLAVPRYLLKRKYTEYALYTFLFLSISISYSHWAEFVLIDWQNRFPFSWRRYFDYKYFFIR